MSKQKTAITEELEEIKQRTKLLTDKIVFYSAEDMNVSEGGENRSIRSGEEYREMEEQLKRVVARENSQREAVQRSAAELEQAKQNYQKIKE